MNTGITKAWHAGAARRYQQRGVTMIFGLIALAIMMIGAAAMVRSMNTSMTVSGNLGFKRDLTNQAERATAAVVTLMNTGALNNELARQSTATSRNYSAKILPTNAQGIPDALVTDANFSTTGVAGNDISVTEQGVSLRYVVDRLCVNDGLADGSHCQMSDLGAPMGGSASVTHRADDSAAMGGGGVLPRQTVYRLSIRVSGPRNTQAYFQTTFTL
jgi:type IV pilus assembly protein PilX